MDSLDLPIPWQEAYACQLRGIGIYGGADPESLFSLEIPEIVNVPCRKFFDINNRNLALASKPEHIAVIVGDPGLHEVSVPGGGVVEALEALDFLEFRVEENKVPAFEIGDNDFSGIQAFECAAF